MMNDYSRQTAYFEFILQISLVSLSDEHGSLGLYIAALYYKRDGINKKQYYHCKYKHT